MRDARSAPPLMKQTTAVLSTRRLALACALAYCGLCGAFLPPPIVGTFDRRTVSSPSSRGWKARLSYGSATSAVRMQQQHGGDDDLQVAVRNLAAQVEDLTAIVRQLATESPPAGVDGADSSPTQNINGADVGNGATVPLVSAKAAKDEPRQLVSTSAAQQRIEQWLQESGGGVAAAPAAVVTPAAPEVVVPPVVPEVVAPPAEVAPVDASPAGSGYKVKIEWDGAIHEVTCDADTTLLEAAMDAGLELPSSCMSGSCLTCPGKIVSGTVDQSEGVLEDEQKEAGFLLTCVSYPQSDVHFTVVDEEDLP